MTLCAPRTWMVIRHARRRRRVEGAEVLEGIAQEGLPAEIHTGGNLESELANGNHRSVAKYGGKVPTNTAADGALGRVI